MLRVNVNCTLFCKQRQVKTGANSHGSWVIRYHNNRRPYRISVKALKDETGGGTSGLPGRSWDRSLEIEVPYEQRPVGLRFTL